MRRRTKTFSNLAVLVLVLVPAACSGGGHERARHAEAGSFRAAGMGAMEDPTRRPARLVPINVDETSAFGLESGGGTRVITAGLRIVAFPKGGVLAAEERLPQPPQSTTALPERLGGGFLFVLGSAIWRADRWLGPAKPIMTSLQAIQSVVPGLDRVYVRAQNAVFAIDGRTGQALDLGPWPASPHVASYAAADGWRAAAVTDLRGLVATFDAGASWRSVELPMEPRQTVVDGGNIAIGGFENKTETWFELRADGSVARMGAPPRDMKTKLAPSPSSRSPGSSMPTPMILTIPTARVEPPPTPSPPTTEVAGVAEDFVVKTFGKRPVAAAIEDGWPLTDGTAVVARDGALARVRLEDGTLTEIVRDAFPLKPSRCHPVMLSRKTGAFGFVCGEPRGATVLYAYEPARGRLVESRRFDKPRVVTSSGNGSLAVRGSCAADADPTPLPIPSPAKLKDEPKPDAERAKDASNNKGKGSPDGSEELPTSTIPRPAANEPPPRPPSATSATASPPAVHPYCVLGPDEVWREIHVRGDAGVERVVVLGDGRIAVISPPEAVGGPARLTLLDRGRATTTAITFPPVSPDVGRVLRLGLWLDGFEERRPGVLGGWIEVGGAMLGIEIALDGKAIPGQYVRDAGLPFVSGKYGLGWTASRRGYETTDGGMTWTSIELPEPLVPTSKVEGRACGPIGCSANGWLRIGWGEAKKPASVAAPPAYRPAAALAVPQVQLACEPLAAVPPPPPVAKEKVKVATVPTPRGRFGGPPVLGSLQGLSELPAFFHQAAPSYQDSDRGINVDVRELADRYPNVGSLARIYGWGPKTGDWDTLGHWQVKWLSPFAGWPEIRASLPALPPPPIVDLTRSGGGYFGGGYTSSYSGGSWQLAPGDDTSHALLIGKRMGRNEGVLFELEADRAPVEIKRADGEPFGEIEGVVRASGRWFLATPPIPNGAAPLTVVWQVEGAVARELARIPRSTGDTSATAAFTASGRAKLARRSDGLRVGLVVDGQPTAERSTNMRWALPIDLETGVLGEPEPIGYTDLAGRVLEACADDVVGWVLDTSIPATTVRIKVPRGGGTINSVHARLRLTRTRACIERLAGAYDGQSPERAAQLARPGASGRAAPRSGEVLVTATSAQTRFPLKCTIDR